MPSVKWDARGLGLAIVGRRKLRGLTLREASAEFREFFSVDLSPATLRRMEIGEVATVAHALAACQWLELPMDSFVRRSWAPAAVDA